MKRRRKAARAVYLVTLGCPKNEVDSEGMASLLSGGGYTPVDRPARADLLIVNTCGFLQPAIEESLSVLEELAEHKRPGQYLVAAGCMSERLGREIAGRVPGVDGIIGTRSWRDIRGFVERLAGRDSGDGPLMHVLPADAAPPRGGPLRLDLSPRASAYLKIGDGCSASCAFCAIPIIKGPQRSRPVEEILQEVGLLLGQGAREIILVAQNTTAYGLDTGQKDGLPTLLEAIVARFPALHWLRVMYTHPAFLSERLIDTMASHPQICRYLDLPLQHAHPDVLRRMGRPPDVEKTAGWIEAFRAAMPGAALRTTFIVGYPGETGAEFEALLDFMQEVRFDRVGIFEYSPEPGTRAFDLPGQVPGEVKTARYGRAMELQQGISLGKNRGFTGKRLEVLVEGAGDGITVARSYRDAPEIDGFVVVEGELPPGELVDVRVYDAAPYDLLARPDPLPPDT